jgi:branched-chain amino acid transport system ATP-binding protein
MSVRPLLEVESLSKRFGGLQAVDRVSFGVPHATIVGLIGPNGAGKTTIFNLIAGVLRCDAGAIRLDGVDIAGLRPDLACGAGIGRTFQVVRPFSTLTVLDNVMVGAFKRTRSTVAARRAAWQILERLGLADKAGAMASSLTLPERKLLLLDEVMAGLRPAEIDLTVGIFAELSREMRLAILLTEHVMRAVMTLSHHIVVVHHGQKICEGTPEKVARDPQVIACYLGTAPTQA